MRKATATLVDRLKGRAPTLAVILGSGLGPLAGEVTDAVRIPYSELEGFPQSGVTGHRGEVVAGRLAGREVVMLSGRSHYYERGDAAAMRPVLEVLSGIGITHLVLTNAAGSLHESMGPGSVMLITDHINFAGANPLIGEPGDGRFVGLTEAYDAGLKAALRRAAQRTGMPMSEGVYMWFSGPSFETPAEIRMARTLGADAVGMSTVPEVILARFLGLKVAACSVITNLAAGMTGAELSHEETKDMAPVGGRRLAGVLKAMLEEGAYHG